MTQADPSLNVETTYQVDFFQRYAKSDQSAVYPLINQDLGSLTGKQAYRLVFAEHVYEIANIGYRVVPFPYITQDSEIQKVDGLDDLFFNKKGNLIDCKYDDMNEELCTALEKYETNDRAEGMLLDCADKHCNFLDAIRTHDTRKCSRLSVYSPPTVSDKAWTQVCIDMVKGNSMGK